MAGRQTSDGPADGRRQRWAQHRAARRTELLEAVMAAVRERGPGIDMDDVTEVSGVAKPVFYRYFDDKADLFLSVGREVGERLVADVVAAVGGTTNPRLMVAAGVETFLEAVEQDPHLYRFVLQRPSTAGAASDYSAVLSKHVSSVIGDVLRAAGRDAGVAEPWGFAIVGAARSAAERWLDEPTLSRAALADALTSLVWRGASAPPRAASGDGAERRPKVRPIRSEGP